jgi:hypothetical protein
MTFDLAKILQSKRALRQHLAGRSIEEKLAMLDALRERALAIRPAHTESGKLVTHEKPPISRVQDKPLE